jgi:hypothetical protein
MFLDLAKFKVVVHAFKAKTYKPFTFIKMYFQWGKNIVKGVKEVVDNV